MKQSELRIGNWYQNKSNDERLKYRQITYIDDIPYVAIYCDPIILTEDWLIRFGWKKIDRYTFNLKGWFIYSRKRGLVTGSKKRELKLNHVHQFQNWWFGNNNYDLECESPQNPKE